MKSDSSEALWSKPSRLSVRWSTRFSRRKRHHSELSNSGSGSKDSIPTISTPRLTASSLSGTLIEDLRSIKCSHQNEDRRGTAIPEHLGSIPEQTQAASRPPSPIAISKPPRVEFERRTSSLINLFLNEEDCFDFEFEKASESPPGERDSRPPEGSTGQKGGIARTSNSTLSIASQASSEPSTQNTEPSPEPVKSDVRKIRSIPTWRSNQQIGIHRLNTNFTAPDQTVSRAGESQRTPSIKSPVTKASGPEHLEMPIEQMKPLIVSPESFAEYREAMNRLDQSRRVQIEQLQNRVKELENFPRNRISNTPSDSTSPKETHPRSRIHGLQPILPIARI